MQPEIRGTCMFLTMARDIWKVVRQTYSKVRDVAHVYEIKTKIGATKQGTFSVTKYYNIMKSLWLELDYYQNIKMKCNEDAAIMLKFVERKRIFDFLVSLNVEYDQVKVQVLGKEDCPPLNEVFSIIRTKEERRSVMLDTPTTEDSALVTIRPNSILSNNNYRGSEVSRSPINKDGLWCVYCKKPRQAKETCWKLHGKSQSKRVCARLEKIQRDFLWGGGALENKPHLVSWKAICAAKKEEGFGIRSLATFNKALLGKWLWRFANENESLWKQIISSKYDRQEGGWCSKGVRDRQGVGVWKVIRNGWENFHSHSRFIIGDGTRVKFWKDVV